MIILDQCDADSDKTLAVPVTRVQTPAPSLPDYEASQSQSMSQRQRKAEEEEGDAPPLQKAKKRRKSWKRMVWLILTGYFVLTIAVGVPIVVVFTMLKRRNPAPPPPYTAQASMQPTITLSGVPLRLNNARVCNAWSKQDIASGKTLQAQLQYTVPVDGAIVLGTNITSRMNPSYQKQFSGRMSMGMNPNKSATDAVITVTMQYEYSSTRQATQVCLMDADADGSLPSLGGLYIFAPRVLAPPEYLLFNIVVLLPRNVSSPHSPLHITSFVSNLPNFDFNVAPLDNVYFDELTLGGVQSHVNVESLHATTAIIRSTNGEIKGKFTSSYQLWLETIGAPISADISLNADDDFSKLPFLYMSTGNGALNANVTVETPFAAINGPHFTITSESFNGVTDLNIRHSTESKPAAIKVDVQSHGGSARVTLDRRYTGTFDIQSTLAITDLMTTDGIMLQHNLTDEEAPGGGNVGDIDWDGQDDYYYYDAVNETAHLQPTVLGPWQAIWDHIKSVSNGQRSIQCDTLSTAKIAGWVGSGPRESPLRYPDSNQSEVKVVSSLGNAQLLLEP